MVNSSLWNTAEVMFGEILVGDGVRKLYVYDKGDVPVLYHYSISKYIKQIFEKHVEDRQEQSPQVKTFSNRVMILYRRIYDTVQ